jgi:hypothetical protein
MIDYVPEVKDGKTVEIATRASDPKKETPSGKSIQVYKCRATTKIVIDLFKAQLEYQSLPPKSEWLVDFPNGQKAMLKPIGYKFQTNQMKLMAEAHQINSRIKRDETEDMMLLDNKELKKLTADSDQVAFEFRMECIEAVISTNGTVVNDRGAIRAWLTRAPSIMIDIIRDKVDEMMAPLKDAGTANFVCPECAHEQKIPIIGDPVLFFTRPLQK